MMTTPTSITRIPSTKHGCEGKTNLGKGYVKQANKFSLKHGKRYGVYRCPHCRGTHLTTRLERKDLYAKLLHTTPTHS